MSKMLHYECKFLWSSLRYFPPTITKLRRRGSIYMNFEFCWLELWAMRFDTLTLVNKHRVKYTLLKPSNVRFLTHGESSHHFRRESCSASHITTAFSCQTVFPSYRKRVFCDCGTRYHQPLNEVTKEQ